MSSSITGIGLAGLQEAGRKIAKTAESIANPNESSDLAADFVDLSTESHAFKANAKVIKLGKELDDTLLNIIA